MSIFFNGMGRNGILNPRNIMANRILGTICHVFHANPPAGPNHMFTAQELNKMKRSKIIRMIPAIIIPRLPLDQITNMAFFKSLRPSQLKAITVDQVNKMNLNQLKAIVESVHNQNCGSEIPNEVSFAIKISMNALDESHAYDHPGHESNEPPAWCGVPRDE